jgi:8-oxo-dGTP pyrophosphatase MutT (NUDIX family)
MRQRNIRDGGDFSNISYVYEEAEETAEVAMRHEKATQDDKSVWDTPESPWRTLGAREVYHNPWLEVVEYAVVRPDGEAGIYGVVNPGDNASVVALDGDGCVYLVGDFCYPLQRYHWSIPTGKVEAGEDPAEAARRELAEEAGITAARWELLGAYDLTPGICTQVGYIYLARDLTLGEPRPEGTERFTQRRLPLAEAYAQCLSGEIRNAVSVLGILRAWLLLA